MLEGLSNEFFRDSLPGVGNPRKVSLRSRRLHVATSGTWKVGCLQPVIMFLDALLKGLDQRQVRQLYEFGIAARNNGSKQLHRLQHGLGVCTDMATKQIPH